MTQLPGGDVNTEEYQDMRDFTPVPPGKYIAKIVSSDMKDTSTGGQMLVLNFEIAAGAYSGKSFVSRLNLVNASATAVKIAREELSTLARACGLSGVLTNSDQMHGIAMVATLKLNPADGKYNPSNSSTGYASAVGLTEPPTNPEPTEAILAIMAGEIPGGTVSATPDTPAPTPPAPAGFAPPPPAPAAEQPATVAPPPPPPAPQAQAQAPAIPAAPAPEVPKAEVPSQPVAPTTESGKPPW